MLLRTLAALALLQSARMPGQAVQQGPPASVQHYTKQQLWTLDRTYVDWQHGVTFRYPAVWRAATSFGYHPPALTQVAVNRPIAGFGYEEGSFPRNPEHAVSPYSSTTLEGFGIVYAAIPATSSKACEKQSAALTAADDVSNSTIRTVRFRGRSYTVRDTGEAGMNQSTGGVLYTTYASGTCYLFEVDESLVSSGMDLEEEGIKPLSDAQNRSIWAGLESIMKTVRISPPGKRLRP